MSAADNDVLLERKQDLLVQMHAQRQLIALQMNPLASGGTYPRSVTMRLLLRHPQLASRIFFGMLRLLRR